MELISVLFEKTPIYHRLLLTYALYKETSKGGQEIGRIVLETRKTRVKRSMDVRTDGHRISRYLDSKIVLISA